MGLSLSRPQLSRPPQLDIPAPKPTPQKSSGDFRRQLEKARNDLAPRKTSESEAPAADHDTKPANSDKDGDTTPVENQPLEVDTANPFLIEQVVPAAITPETTPAISDSEGTEETSQPVSSPGDNTTPPSGFCPTRRPFQHLSVEPRISHRTPQTPNPSAPTLTELALPQNAAEQQAGSAETGIATTNPLLVSDKIGKALAEEDSDGGAVKPELLTLTKTVSHSETETKKSFAIEDEADVTASRQVSNEQAIDATKLPNGEKVNANLQPPSMQQQKIDLSRDQANQSAIAKRNRANGSASRLERPVALSQKSSNIATRAAQDTDAQLPQLKVVSARGDESAASIAKFLVTGSQGDSTANAATQTQPAPNPTPTQDTTSSRNSVESSIGSPLSIPGPSESTDSQKDAIESAVQMMRASKQGGKFHATLRLDPPQLGPIKLQIQMRDQLMSLQVDTQTHGVARLMETRLSELRDALSAHGVTIDRTDIAVRAADPSDSAQHQKSDQQHNGDQNRSSWESSQNYQGFEDAPHQSWRERYENANWGFEAGSFPDELKFEDVRTQRTIETDNSWARGSLNLIA